MEPYDYLEDEYYKRIDMQADLYVFYEVCLKQGITLILLYMGAGKYLELMESYGHVCSWPQEAIDLCKLEDYHIHAIDQDIDKLEDIYKELND